MKYAITFIALIIRTHCFAQCPFTAIIKDNGSMCLGKDTLIISPGVNISKIIWYNGGTVDTTVTAVTSHIPNGITVAGGNGRGKAANQFNLPSSVFVDGAGNIYVADQANSRVQKFPPGSTGATNGQTIAGGNGVGKALNQIQPTSVYVDGNGYLFVADNANARILKFPPGSDGSTNGIVAAGGNGQGTAPNQFGNPLSVFADVAGNIYVVDAINDRVQKFRPGSTTGTTVAGGRGYGPAADQFNGPACVFVDAAGNIFVDDAANNRIQKFLPNSLDGITVAGGNGVGTALNQLTTPASVWVDVDGNIYVADGNNERIQKFPPGSSSSTNGKTVAGGNGLGSSPRQLSGPNSVCVDGNGDIYVCDAGNSRIQKFSQQPVTITSIDTTYIPSAPGIYTAIAWNNAGCTDTTNAITINPPVNPAIGIKGSADALIPCNSTVLDTIRFTAATVNGGATPAYQWQVNGVNAGVDSSGYTAALANNDVVTCILTSNAACAVTAPVTSNSYKVAFSPTPIATLQNQGNLCLGPDTLVINTNIALSRVIWLYGNNADTAIAAINGATYIPITAGTYTAAVTNTTGCTDTTNAIIISPTVTPTVNISADKPTVCASYPVTFTASAANTGPATVYQWQVNGTSAGANNPAFTTTALANGDLVNCILPAQGACISQAVSNTITAAVSPLPVAGPANDVLIRLGQSIQLNIPVTGDIASYAWSPPVGLSNTTILAPVANPSVTTSYTLKVATGYGCTDTATITVKVLSKIMIPNAFSPNHDGNNDVFFVLGGEDGDIIRDFSIYSRWGTKLFQEHDVLPNDPSSGWSGYYKGHLQPAASYVYIAVVGSANGKDKVYKGTVVLMR